MAPMCQCLRFRERGSARRQPGVASRQPCTVVSNSGTACRCAERRVGKIGWYQSLAMKRRQSRASLSGEIVYVADAEDLGAPLMPGHQAGNATEARSRLFSDIGLPPSSHPRAARATPPPYCHGEVPHHIAGSCVRNCQLLNWYVGNDRAIPNGERTVFGLPCRFPATPSILAERRS